MNESIQKYLSEIGKRGGRVSRRQLSTEDARKMVRVREARRAFRSFYSLCFWSYDPDLLVKEGDIPWVCRQLRQHGDRKAWDRANALCR